MSSTSTEPSIISGNLHSAKGAAVETIGNMTGAETWQASGKDERAAGNAEHDAARASGYAEGVLDRAKGKVDAVLGALTGDRQREQAGRAQHEQGEAQQHPKGGA